MGIKCIYGNPINCKAAASIVTLRISQSKIDKYIETIVNDEKLLNACMNQAKAVLEKRKLRKEQKLRRCKSCSKKFNNNTMKYNSKQNI